ncbi:MAG: dihydroneopterin aldolase [Rikenellaceae bacterium]|nr:dihydroneopterin aldolase [Rikenellaceae bacterium]
MITTIRVEGAEFRAYHGCYDLEKKVGNRFVVDVCIEAEIGDAAERDDVTSTVNYLTVYELIREEMAITSNIVENVALRIADRIKASWNDILRVEVRVTKLAPPLGGKVARVSATIIR